MNILNKKAVSIIEYTVLFIIVIGAFLVMSKYIQRGIFGNWGQSGKAFAFGRQYDAQKSVDCGFDEQSNVWYDRNCFKYKGCSFGDVSCEENCPGTGGLESMCNQLNNSQSSH